MVNKVGQRVGRKRRPEDIRGSVLINVRPTAVVISQEAEGGFLGCHRRRHRVRWVDGNAYHRYRPDNHVGPD
jgi:hypothetical protein